MERLKVSGLTQAQVDAEREAEERAQVNDEARAYLRETDWYVIRAIENAGQIPDEIREKRQAARGRVKEHHERSTN